MQCKKCGGELELMGTEQYVDEVIKPEPSDRVMQLMVHLLMPKPYQCQSCKQLFSSYQVLGENLVSVEPLDEVDQ